MRDEKGQSSFRFLEAGTAAERMSELERFIEFWYGPRQAEYGTPEEELGELPLPYPLRRFYAFAGQWPGPQASHPEDLFYLGGGGHHLLSPDGLEIRDDGRLYFFMEYQGDWDGLTLTEGDDPPVWIRGVWETEEEETNGEQEQQVSDSLSKFLITHVLMATAYEDINYAVGAWETLTDWFRSEQQNAALLWSAQDIRCPQYEGDFFLLHERILVHQTRSSLRFTALHPEAEARIREQAAAMDNERLP